MHSPLLSFNLQIGKTTHISHIIVINQEFLRNVPSLDVPRCAAALPLPQLLRPLPLSGDQLDLAPEVHAVTLDLQLLLLPHEILALVHDSRRGDLQLEEFTRRFALRG